MSKEVKRYEPEYGVMDMAEDGQGGWVPWDDYEALLDERDRLQEALDAVGFETAHQNISYVLRDELLGQLAGDHEPEEMLCVEDFYDWLEKAIDNIRADYRKAEGSKPVGVYASAALQGEQPCT